jgi:hypothetical protein
VGVVGGSSVPNELRRDLAWSCFDASNRPCKAGRSEHTSHDLSAHYSIICKSVLGMYLSGLKRKRERHSVSKSKSKRQSLRKSKSNRKTSPILQEKTTKRLSLLIICSLPILLKEATKRPTTLVFFALVKATTQPTEQPTMGINLLREIEKELSSV